MPRKRSPKIDPVKLKKLFLSPELKALAVGRAGGPMKVTKWIVEVLEAFLSVHVIGRYLPPDPGTGPDTLSLELPLFLCERIAKVGKFSSIVRRALHEATSEA